MSKLYVTANSDAVKTSKHARGHHWVKATAQSWKGSLQVTMDENENVEIRLADTSTTECAHLLLACKLDDLVRYPGGARKLEIVI